MLYLLNMFGVAVFAVSGALTAGRKSLDPFGVIVIAVIRPSGAARSGTCCSTTVLSSG